MSNLDMDRAPLMSDVDGTAQLIMQPPGLVKADDVVKPPKTLLRKILHEALSLLQWSMLAACTIGPGTVVMCSKAGAESGLKLVWVLVAASYVAFMLQKEAARLTLESGKTFGEAIRIHFGTPGSNKVPKMGYAITLAIFVGNTALEANCFAGAEAALFVLYDDLTWFRVLTSFLTGIFTLVALIWGNVDRIGQMLGLVVVAMTIIFIVTATKVPPIYDAVNITDDANHTSTRNFSSDFWLGFIPNLPDGQAGNALSLMATTAIPFNTFLAAAMTEMADSPAQMKRGVSFATGLAMVISILVVIIGSAIQLDEGQSFGVKDLGDIIGDALGGTIQTLFCIGLYAAAYSSAVTIPLGAALTAKQIFFDGRVEPQQKPRELRSVVGEPNEELSQQSRNSERSSELRHPKQSSSSLKSVSLSEDGTVRKNSLASLYEDEDEDDPEATATLSPTDDMANTTTKPPLRSARWDTNGLYFRGTMILAVGFSVITASAGLDPVKVIFTAQIIGGLLLPWVTICLFLCLNDTSILPTGTSALDNVGVLSCVFITIFLAGEMIVGTLAMGIGGDHGADRDSAWEVTTSITVAFVIAAVLTLILGLVTLPCNLLRRGVGMRQLPKRVTRQLSFDYSPTSMTPTPTTDTSRDIDDNNNHNTANNSNSNSNNSINNDNTTAPTDNINSSMDDDGTVAPTTSNEAVGYKFPDKSITELQRSTVV
eukprot:m.194656 g.194656  ORF g.194656 m.194656 type:complete len:711 (+) comp32539_c0_seq1:146-2278(+)